MTISHDKNIFLSKLACANCAQKIESQVSQLEGIQKATLDFSTQKLSMTRADDADWKDLSPQVETIVHQIEPDIIITNKRPSRTEISSNSKARLLLPSGLGLIFFCLALLGPFVHQVQLVLFLMAYVLIGRNVLLSAFRNIKRGDFFDENFLMAIASLSAFAIGEYPEAIAVMLFYSIGEWAQDKAVDNSRRSIQGLVDIQPAYANLLKNNTTERVSPEEIQIGDTIVIRAGERVPLDGIVIEGQSTLDTATITGEAEPRSIDAGENIYSGSINLQGNLHVKVTETYQNSTVSLVLDMVEHATAHKAPTEKFITRFARYYTPIVVFSAVALAILPPLFLAETSFSTWFYRALVFLVASCPCALVLSIPLSFYAGVGAASKKGILFKGGNYLETLSKVTHFAFDKTGTLTKGSFALIKTQSLGSYREEDLIRCASLMEANSNHPIAKAFPSEKYEAQSQLVKELQELAGNGLSARIASDTFLLGNRSLMEKYGISVPDQHDPHTHIFLAINQRLEGIFIVSDTAKKEAQSALTHLKSQGITNLTMLTGDNPYIAEDIAQKLGIDQVYSNLLPQDKVTMLTKLEQAMPDKETLAYVGDGINDAPVLATADVGIAMGEAGSDIAIEAADVIITTDNLNRLNDALEISKKTMAIVFQNIVFAIGIKLSILILGALGIVSMWAAVFADVGVALLCVLNAMRILRS